MARTTFLRPLSAFVLFAAVPIIAACNGHVISLGTSDTMKSVAADTVSGTPGACPSGWVHPNICCSSTDSSAGCGAWEQNPLRACEAGDTTYPDPLSCCELSNPRNCVNTPDDAGVVTAPPPPAYCGYACPPGWTAEADPINPGYGNMGPSCCITYADGSGECQGQVSVPVAISTPACGTTSNGSGGGTVTPVSGQPVDAGTSTDASAPSPLDAGIADAGPIPDDAGVWTDDGGCTYDDDAGSTYYGDGGTAGLCPVCPAGWNAPASQPELCCTTLPSGTSECFSQATGSAYGIGTSGDVDAGVSSSEPTGGSSGGSGTAPSSGWGTGGANGASCSGSDSSCSCDQTSNGHTYALDCFVGASGVPTCTCSIDGVSSGTASVSSCQDSTAVQNGFTATTGCGFP